MRVFFAVLLFMLFLPKIGLEKTNYVDLVIVKKSESKLYLMKKGKIFKTYHIALGKNPKGKKLKQGDAKTPEGKHILDYKNSHSKFHKSIYISYPNKHDRERAKKAHVNPGGNIMIHGQKNRRGSSLFFTQKINWTKGCIAATNKNTDEIWKYVKVKPPIEIQP